VDCGYWKKNEVLKILNLIVWALQWPLPETVKLLA
jgi:hypothetical protein